MGLCPTMAPSTPFVQRPSFACRINQLPARENWPWGRTAGTCPNASDVITASATPASARAPGRGPGRSGADLKAVVESVVDLPEISNACRQCTGLSLVRDGFGLPKKFRATLDRANVLQQFEPFIPVPHSSKRRESPPTDDRAARPKSAFEDAAGLMECDRTTTSWPSARTWAPPARPGLRMRKRPCYRRIRCARGDARALFRRTRR